MSAAASTRSRWGRRAALFALLLALAAAPARASQLDALDLGLRARYPLPVLWDNIEGRPAWIAGPALRKRSGSRFHTVTLAAGQSVLVHQARGAALRLAAPAGELEQGALAVEVSSGSPLFVGRALARRPDGSLELPADERMSRLVRIGRPAGPPVVIALFSSRRDVPGTMAPRRRIVPAQGPRVRVRRADEATETGYWKAGPGRPLTALVAGPARLELELRLAYPPREERPRQVVRLTVDAGAAGRFVEEVATTEETIYTVLVDGRALPVGRVDAAFVDLPAGSKSLTLEASQDIYVRILRLAGPDYLLPGRNAPSSSGGAGALVDAYRSALATGLDNTIREGGVKAVNVMRDAMRARPDAPALLRAADTVADRSTAYLDAPATPPPGALIRRAWFTTRALRDPEEPGRDGLVAAQHLGGLLEDLSSGQFVSFPPGAGTTAAIEFSLPERSEPTLARLLVSGAGEQRLRVLLDGAGRIDAHLVPESAIAGAPRETTRGEAALALLAWAADGRPAATSAALFARYRDPAPYEDATVAELPLAAGVRRVRVTREEGSGPVAVAFQYRASPLHRLAENEYLERMESLGPARHQALMERVLAGQPQPDAAPAGRDLVNQWVPLSRLVNEEAARFASGYSPGAQLPHIPGPAPLARALAAEKSGQWATALESWQLVLAAGGEHRRDALFGRVRALEAQGEGYLAERLLRGVVLYEKDAAARDEAVARLRATYEREGDERSLLALAAYDVRRGPAPARVRALAEALWRSGHDEMALWISLSLPPAERQMPLALRAALGERWYVVAQRVADETPDLTARGDAHVERLAAAGRADEAIAVALRAGPSGRELVRLLSEGLDIERRLAAPAAAARAAAIAGWEAWSARIPGPRRFHEEPVVVDHAGAVLLRSIGRDIVATSYLATGARPVRARVAGPGRVRLQARPLHARGPAVALDDWLEVRMPGCRIPLPVLNNLPSEGVEVVSGAGGLVGTEVREVLELGPGVHELSVAGRDAAYVVDVLVERSDVRPGALPAPTVAGRAAALRGDWVRTPPAAADGRTLRIVHPSDRGGQTIVPLAWPRPIQGGAPDALSAAAPAGYAGLVAQDLAQDRLDRALERKPESDADRVVRLRLLLLAIEDDEDARPAAQLEADAMIREHPTMPGALPLAQRILAGRDWEPLLDVESDGQRQLEVAPSRVEAPTPRVRAALAGPLGRAEQPLMGRGELALFRQDPAATRVVVDLIASDIAFLPPSDLTVEYRVDDGPARSVTLGSGATHRVEVAMPAGEHTLRIGLSDPLANQLLRVRFQERTLAGLKPLADTEQRMVHVATHARPARVRLEGPALLRVDDASDGATVTSFRDVGPGWHEIVLTPRPGQAEALLRIFRSVPGDDEPARARYVPFRVAPPAVGTAPATPAIAGVRQVEWPLGDQEDGTWSAGGRAVRRRAVQEDRDRQLAPEEFREAKATYRYFDSYRRNNWYGGVLGRRRDDGGEVLGLEGAFRHETARIPATVLVETSLFLQEPGGAFSPVLDDLESSFSLRGSVRQQRRISPRLTHSPSVSLHARLLSLTDGRTYPVARVDQDIFTPYKADHRSGIVVAEDVAFRPYLDSLIYGTLALSSNELDDPNPDNVRFATGVRQRAGDLELELGFRSTHFYKDKDRARPSDREFLVLEATGDLYRQLRRRIEVGVQLIQDLNRDETTGFATATWHFGHARGYRDVRPGEAEFLELRRRRSSEESHR